ncbi:tRNA (32-2'-O)-methyltransferase regulator THADA-like [Antedon mediterranea]|uniref:tRNA (32-2'-O)-methyltransferase regulator THADA-like n=1 Tax=Antedon mediterranea TaxID=105859 RepID=UPI003AF9F78A
MDNSTGKKIDDLLQCMLSINSGSKNEDNYEYRRTLIEAISYAYICSLGNKADSRKAAKVVQLASRSWHSELMDSMQSHLNKLLINSDGQHLTKVCHGLEENKLFREAVNQDILPLISHINQTLVGISKHFNSQTHDQIHMSPSKEKEPMPESTNLHNTGGVNSEDVAFSRSTMDKMDLCYTCVKVCLLTFQYLQEAVAVLLWETSPAGHSLASKLVNNLQAVLSQGYSKDCNLIAGSALAMLLNTVPTVDQARNLVQLLSHDLDVDAVKIGNIEIKGLSHDQTHGPYSKISLFRGILTCCKPRLLLSTNKSKDSILLHSLFCEVVSICRSSNHSILYNAFQLLVYWFDSAIATMQQYVTSTPERKTHFHSDSLFVKTTLQLVWENWQNPLSGVPAFVKAIFGLLLEIHQNENHLFGICSSDLYQSLANHLLQVSWHVKGKYTLLCSLVPYVGALNLLSKHPTLPRQLIRGLATNFLASAVSDLHKVLLQNMVEEVKLLGLAGDEKSVAAAKWKDIWGECVADVICSETDLVRFHGAQYWLPWILKCFPGAYESLVTSLELIPNSQSMSSKRRLHGVVMVMAQARHADIVDCKIISETNMASISTALYHVDDDIRLHALALICNSPRKAEPVQQFELDMLQRFLPLNLNCDGASFRQKMCAYIKVIITRIRNSCLSSLKILARKKPEVTAEVDDKTEESEHILMSGIGFLDWLLKDLVQSLFPGACYQRKRAALGLLEIMFELMLSGQGNKRKGKTPENTNNLIKWAQQQGMCNFICERTCSIFLECLLDGSNDIRDLAYKLLSTHFPWPLPKAVASQADGYGVVSQGLRLISSPKSPECEAGAKLSMLVFQRHILEGTCTTSHLVGTFESSKVELMNGGPEEALSFLTQLTGILAHQLKCCSTNILKGSFTTPMHGILLTIRNCLMLNLPVLREVILLDRDGWSSLINNLIDISSNIVTLAMSALGGIGGKIGAQMSPSFADMGEGINDLVEKMKDCQMESEAEVGILCGDDSPAMSADYQLIMACCWLNLKEVSLLLAELSQFAYLPVESKDALLTRKHLHTMIDMFVNILTKCRHRGAIEGCNIGFSRLCASLLSSSSQELAAIPRTLVEDVIHLITNEGSTTSFTKKSAGLPLLVEAVINSEPRGREKTLLHFTMTSLLKIAQEPEPVEHDPKIDLPQCHALNMLKALFRSAAINDDVMPYTSKSAIIAINGFASKHFSIRNGSMLLFGSLVARMFGQKRVQDEHSRLNCMTAHEFFVHYPELQSFLLQEICKCIDQQKSGNNSLHPSLFPVLIILSKLGCGLQSGETSILAQFVQPVMQLSSSPVYQVRSLAAEGLVPLVAEDGILLQAVCIINMLPQSSQELFSQNQLHGQLLQIQKLFSAYMDNCQGPLPSLEVQTACRRLCEFQWIGRNDNKCPLTRAVFVDTVTKVVSWTLIDKTNINASVLADDICSMAKCHIQIQETHQISDCVLSNSMVNSLLSLNQTQFIDNLQSMFKSRSPDVILPAQLFLLKHLQRGCQTSIQSLVPLIPDILNMINSLKEETSLLENTLKLFVEISVRFSHNLCVDWPRHWDSLLELANGVKGVGVSCAAIPALAVIVKGMLCEGCTFRCDLQPFCRLLITNSQVTAPETCRFAVASSLKIVGAIILKEVQSQKNEEIVVHALSLFSAALNLLQDETSEIRCEASQFVSNLSNDITYIQLEMIQPSNALQMIIKYMCQSFRWSNVCFSNLYSRLVGNSVEINIKNQSTGNINLFEQDDANIYWEPAQLARFIHKELMVSVTTLAKEDPEALRSWVMSNLTTTKDQINRLHKQLSTKTSKFGSFFDISGSSKSYSLIMCQLLQVDLLVSANRLLTCDAALDFSQLYITITDLTKIENLHPFLQDQMNEIINHEQTQSSNIEDNL